MLASLVPALLQRRSPLKPLAAAESAPVAARAGATVYVQFLCFYAAAAFWKHNDAWMSPRVSCAPIYLVSLMETHLPRWLLSPWLLSAVTAWAPALVLLVEAIVPVLMLVDTRVAVAFTGLFHWMIAIVPPPNDIASFGCQTIPRLLLLVDPEAAAGAVHGLLDPTWGAPLIVGVAAVTTALQPITWRGTFDWAVPVCGALTAIACIAAARSRSGSPPALRAGGGPGIGGWALMVLAAVYAFLLVPLGLMDTGNASPFSSLRKHGTPEECLAPLPRHRRAHAA